MARHGLPAANFSVVESWHFALAAPGAVASRVRLVTPRLGALLHTAPSECRKRSALWPEVIVKPKTRLTCRGVVVEAHPCGAGVTPTGSVVWHGPDSGRNSDRQHVACIQGHRRERVPADDYVLRLRRVPGDAAHTTRQTRRDRCPILEQFDLHVEVRALIVTVLEADESVRRTRARSTTAGPIPRST